MLSMCMDSNDVEMFDSIFKFKIFKIKFYNPKKIANSRCMRVEYDDLLNDAIESNKEKIIQYLVETAISDLMVRDKELVSDIFSSSPLRKNHIDNPIVIKYAKQAISNNKSFKQLEESVEQLEHILKSDKEDERIENIKKFLKLVEPKPDKLKTIFDSRKNKTTTPRSTSTEKSGGNFSPALH